MDFVQVKEAKSHESPLILLLSGHESTQDLIAGINKSFSEDYELLQIPISDWDNELTPWPDNTCLKGRSFGGNAGTLLKEIQEKILNKYKNRRIMLAGYSLAGLFTLWAAYLCEEITDAICCSGSLWYPGWESFMSENTIQRDVNIYLSLGMSEPKSKNPFMRRVGELTEKQYELLQQNPNVKHVTFEWNEGGHFADANERLAKGILWALNQKER